MKYLVDLIVSGVAIGAIYGLLAMSFAAIYKATSVVNFAQGEVMMLITYITATVLLVVPLPFWAALLVAIAIGVVVGLVIERAVIRPMIGQPPFAIVMATIGLAVAMRSLIVLIWGSSPFEMPGRFAGDVLKLGSISLYSSQFTALFLFAAAVMASWACLRYSRIGIAMRATAIDKHVAMLMGVDVGRISALTWCTAAALSGIAGLLFATISFVGPGLFSLGLKAFPATILGGLDSIIGSAIGGVLIGIVENLVGGYLDSTSREIAGFALIILVLMIRPNGLFGDKDVERV